jgi:long-chain acyl-CoA synthetase
LTAGTPGTLGDGLSFWQRAATDPERLAIVEPDGTCLSAGEVAARSNRLAGGLLDLGLRKGDRAAVLLPNGHPLIELALAALQSGSTCCRSAPT